MQPVKGYGCGLDFELHNLEIDHIIPQAKGESDRPMEYLRVKKMKPAKRCSIIKYFGENKNGYQHGDADNVSQYALHE
ncbi:hypothetical protein AGMMS49959_13470 [Planctomycetales bacterium]|nr:hypothetical protein AGMMS49959_13470 [Planctomycetales bacterium]